MPSNDMSKTNKEQNGLFNIKWHWIQGLVLAYRKQQSINIWGALHKHHYGEATQTAATTKRKVFLLLMIK